jgi:hypothetical protein
LAIPGHGSREPIVFETPARQRPLQCLPLVRSLHPCFCEPRIAAERHEAIGIGPEGLGTFVGQSACPQAEIPSNQLHCRRTSRLTHVKTRGGTPANGTDLLHQGLGAALRISQSCFFPTPPYVREPSQESRCVTQARKQMHKGRRGLRAHGHRLLFFKALWQFGHQFSPPM